MIEWRKATTGKCRKLADVHATALANGWQRATKDGWWCKRHGVNP